MSRKRIVCAFAQVLRNRCCGSMPERENLLQRLHSLACPNQSKPSCAGAGASCHAPACERNSAFQNLCENVSYARTFCEIAVAAPCRSVTTCYNACTAWLVLVMKKPSVGAGASCHTPACERNSDCAKPVSKAYKLSRTFCEIAVAAPCRSVTTCYNACAGLAS